MRTYTPRPEQERETKAKTLVRIDDGRTIGFETIEHDGVLWIATTWEKTPYPNMWRPVRLVRLDPARLRDMGRYPNDVSLHLYSLDAVIPKAALFDPTPSAPDPRFDVLEGLQLLVHRKGDLNQP
jgi:hypothetical protein